MPLSEWNMDVALKVRAEEGEMKRAREIAKGMKDKGMDVNTIVELTKLTIDEILKI